VDASKPGRASRIVRSMRWLDRLLRNFFTHARQRAIENFYTGQLRLLDAVRFDDISQSGFHGERAGLAQANPNRAAEIANDNINAFLQSRGRFARARSVSYYRGPTVNAAAPALNPWERAVTWILPGRPSSARTISIAFP
jgi:hypothetical protein